MKRFLVVAVEFALISWAIGYGSMGWFVDAKWFGWLIGIAAFVGMWQWFHLPRAGTVLVGLLCVPWTILAFGATFGATAEWWWPYQWSTSLMAALFGGAIAWSIHEWARSFEIVFTSARSQWMSDSQPSISRSTHHNDNRSFYANITMPKYDGPGWEIAFEEHVEARDRFVAEKILRARYPDARQPIIVRES